MDDDQSEKFKSPGEAAEQVSDTQKQSKQYYEVNFQFNYSGDDENPIKVGIDVNTGASEKPKVQMMGNQRSSKPGSFDVYDTSNIIFIEPMFLVDMKNYRNFTMKISLEKFIETQKNMCRQAISLLNRQNNKRLFLQYLTSLLINKKLNLFSASMIFMKIC